MSDTKSGRDEASLEADHAQRERVIERELEARERDEAEGEPVEPGEGASVETDFDTKADE